MSGQLQLPPVVAVLAYATPGQALNSLGLFAGVAGASGQPQSVALAKPQDMGRPLYAVHEPLKVTDQNTGQRYVIVPMAGCEDAGDHVSCGDVGFPVNHAALAYVDVNGRLRAGLYARSQQTPPSGYSALYEGPSVTLVAPAALAVSGGGRTVRLLVSDPLATAASAYRYAVDSYPDAVEAVALEQPTSDDLALAGVAQQHPALWRTAGTHVLAGTQGDPAAAANTLATLQCQCPECICPPCECPERPACPDPLAVAVRAALALEVVRSLMGRGAARG